MDKETLSNYGWIVICVLVLAVMIALATPFGSFIANAVKSTTAGLFTVSQNALNQTNLIPGGIPDQSFGEDETQIEEFPEAGAVLTSYPYDNDGMLEYKSCYIEMTWDEFIANKSTYGYSITESSGNVTFDPGEATFKEIILPESTTKFKYSSSEYNSVDTIYISKNISQITIAESSSSIGEFVVDKEHETLCSVDGAIYNKDMSKIVLFPSNKSGEFEIPSTVTEIGSNAFASAVINLTIPKSITYINSQAFADTYWNSITYKGTVEEWKQINKHSNYGDCSYFDYMELLSWGGTDGTKIICTDGTYCTLCDEISVGIDHCSRCAGETECQHLRKCYHTHVQFCNHENAEYDEYDEITYCECGFEGDPEWYEEYCSSCDEYVAEGDVVCPVCGDWNFE